MNKWARPSTAAELPSSRFRDAVQTPPPFQRSPPPHKHSPSQNARNRPTGSDRRLNAITAKGSQEKKAKKSETERNGRNTAKAADKETSRADAKETTEGGIRTLAATEDTEDSHADTNGKHNTRNPKMARQMFKERGSIASRLSQLGSVPMIPSHSRVKPSQIHKPKEREKKPRAAKKVSLDIFIPSVVSVGNFAKLLNIRLGQSIISAILILRD